MRDGANSSGRLGWNQASAWRTPCTSPSRSLATSCDHAPAVRTSRSASTSRRSVRTRIASPVSSHPSTRSRAESTPPRASAPETWATMHRSGTTKPPSGWKTTSRSGGSRYAGNLAATSRPLNTSCGRSCSAHERRTPSAIASPPSTMPVTWRSCSPASASRSRQSSYARRRQRHVVRMLEVGEPDDAGEPVRRALVVEHVEALEPEHALPAAGEVVERRAPHSADTDDDDVVALCGRRHSDDQGQTLGRSSTPCDSSLTVGAGQCTPPPRPHPRDPVAAG